MELVFVLGACTLNLEEQDVRLSGTLEKKKCLGRIIMDIMTEYLVLGADLF